MPLSPLNFLASNNNGSSTASVSSGTAPTAPTIAATANSNGTEIDLALTSDSATSYMQILRDGTQIYSGNIVSTYADTGLAPDSSHGYVVTTSNANGSSSASTGGGAAPSVPAVTATGNGPNEIDLTIAADSNEKKKRCRAPLSLIVSCQLLTGAQFFGRP